MQTYWQTDGNGKSVGLSGGLLNSRCTAARSTSTTVRMVSRERFSDVSLNALMMSEHFVNSWSWSSSQDGIFLHLWSESWFWSSSRPREKVLSLVSDFLSLLVVLILQDLFTYVYIRTIEHTKEAAGFRA